MDKKRHMMGFSIPQELHTEVKILAARRNISMGLWMKRAIIHYIKSETHYDKK